MSSPATHRRVDDFSSCTLTSWKFHGTPAEFGWGSAPAGMVMFDAGQGPMVLLTHSHKSADLMSVADIADASTKPGLSTPIKWPAEPTLGLKSTYVPMRVALIDNQDGTFFVALRRNEASGAMELVTVLMDPGRVKSGVGPNLDAGRALNEGGTVSLRVAGSGVDASPVVKTWRVTAAVSQLLQPELLQLSLPRRGTRDALSVDLRTPISSAGERLIAVLDKHGHRIDGTVTLDDGDATSRFKPSRPWATGLHRLVTHPGLEDVAGNRRCAAFEAPIRPAATCKGASLEFTPRGAP